MQPSDTSASPRLQPKEPSTAPPAAATLRTLLTGRWHASSRVVGVLVLLFLVFCNLPGQLVQSGAYNSLIEDWLNGDRFEHGWPMTWMTRRYSYLFAEDSTVWACFNLADETARLRPAALPVNIAAILLISLGTGVAFEFWRRQRPRLWQLHLRDIVLLTTLACLAAGWYAAKRHAKAQEEAALARDEAFTSDATRNPRPYLDAGRMREGGITWLRRLVGDAPFEPFDRALDLTVNRAGLLVAGPCTEIGSLRVISPLKSEDLAHLENFRHLRELLIHDGVSPETGRPIELPRLARLRALDISASDVFLTGFGHMPNLEWIELDSTPLNRSMLRDMASLPKLKTVRLFPTSLEPGCLQELAALNSLESLVVEGKTLHDDDMRGIGQLAQAKEFSFGPQTILPGGVRYLQGLRNVVTLDLSHNCVRDDDICHLAVLPKLENLNLDDTAITAAATAHLSRLKQLRKLTLPKSNFSAEDLAALKKALPDCDSYVASIRAFP